MLIADGISNSFIFIWYYERAAPATFRQQSAASAFCRYIFPFADIDSKLVVPNGIPGVVEYITEGLVI